MYPTHIVLGATTSYPESQHSSTKVEKKFYAGPDG